ncbi:protocadherin-10-like [Triplophysa rosa]|uniref:protocadherin-10-like n=1 Tax=Triplophysa rosa TaxID=992332 RepID=UPI002545C6FD|nr:protocadherin-10-like [Triplophysa rosa]
MDITENSCFFKWISFLFVLIWNHANGHIVYSVSEEVNAGTTVGNLAKDLNLNVQDLEKRGFQTVSGTNERYFDLNVKNGIIFVRERIDREELCGRRTKCALELEAIVNAPMNVYRFEVMILDVNDNAPLFRTSKLYLNVSELTFSGQKFTLPTAFDADVGSNSVKSYKLSPNEHFSLDIQSGGEQSVSAELVLQKALDREKQPVIQLTLTAVDGGKPPSFKSPKTQLNIAESAFPGERFTLPSAFDADVGSNSVKSYKLSPNEHFSLDVQSGGEQSVSAELVLQKALDREKTVL